MKNYLFATALFISASLFSQNMSIEDAWGNDVTSGVSEIWNDTLTSSAYVADYKVKMLNGTNKRIMVKRYTISAVPGTANLFCWESCYGPTVSISPVSIG